MTDQARLLKTAIPGPRSVALHEARAQQVARGFGITMPVFVDHADGA